MKYPLSGLKPESWPAGAGPVHTIDGVWCQVRTSNSVPALILDVRLHVVLLVHSDHIQSDTVMWAGGLSHAPPPTPTPLMFHDETKSSVIGRFECQSKWASPVGGLTVWQILVCSWVPL